MVAPAAGASAQEAKTEPQSQQPQAGSSSKQKSSVASVDKVDSLNDTLGGDKFQYIMAASTSLATKINEPTITYLNQGQAYEVRLKKLGDLSAYRRRRLKSTMRICFHERRLQYMEAEQIADWRVAHPGERILDLDLPLSYGLIDARADPTQLNVVSFKWDPTRDTGVFIKVNCISTEFTPKKHGGEKGVPFRLQVETFDADAEDLRLHAAGCILQVFKLKGADRKHKQDKEKVGKRPQQEQEKYAPSYESTVLTDLSVENIYVPPSSRPQSPTATGAAVSASPVPREPGSREVSPAMRRDGSLGRARDDGSGGGSGGNSGGFNSPMAGTPSREPERAVGGISSSSSSFSRCLPLNASVEAVTQWLSRNRYGAYIGTFRNYNGRDMLRLMREEVITMCGLNDGVRLFNDLHMAPVAPRTTFYVASKDSQEYCALFLEDLTVRELLLRFAQAIGVTPSLFSRVMLLGPIPGMLVRMTDEVVQYTKPESVFQFALRPFSQQQQQPQAGGDGQQQQHYDVVLENVTALLEGLAASNDLNCGPSHVPPPPPPSVEPQQQQEQQQQEQQHASRASNRKDSR